MVDIQTLDVVIKGATSAIGLIGAYVAVMKWLDQRHKDSLTAKVEAQKPFSLKQQEIYSELVDTTAIISNEMGREEWDAAVRRFWVMYWGVVPLVADEGVSAATDKFSEALDDVENGVALRNASMDLARACRVALGESWNADLQPYPKSDRARFSAR